MWFKHILAAVVSLGLLLNVAPRSEIGGITAHGTNTRIVTPKVIRFRVIANSDNPIDQAVKLDVRDAVLRVLEPRLDQVTTFAQAQTVLKEMDHRVLKVAKQVLKSEKASYQARVTLGTTAFPTKVYGSWVLPAGRYTALLVTLGRGDGHNWWCVLFPSLCFIDMGNAVAVPYRTTLANPVPLPQRTVPAVTEPVTGHIAVSWSPPNFIRHLLQWL
jgi:stage II sporulation protein R